MIVINNENELEKYKTIQNQRGLCDYVIYEFKESGDLSDVEINIEFCPTKDSLFKGVFQNLSLDELPDANVDFNLYIIRARNVYLNKPCMFDILEAENVYSKCECGIDTVNITNEININDLHSLEIKCRTLKCGSVSAETIIAETMQGENVSATTISCADQKIKNLRISQE